MYSKTLPLKMRNIRTISKCKKIYNIYKDSLNSSTYRNTFQSEASLGVSVFSLRAYPAHFNDCLCYSLLIDERRGKTIELLFYHRF